MRSTHPRLFRAAVLATALLIGGCTDTASSEQASGSDVVPAGEVVAPSPAGADITLGTDTVTTTDIGVVTTENQASHFDSNDLDYDEADVIDIALDGASATSDSRDVTIDGSTVMISAEGTYSLSGTLDDGEIIVDIGDDDDVTIVLDGVDITNTDGAALSVTNADDAVVLLADGSTNSLTDGETYSHLDDETDEPNATLFSAADLTIAGDGELVVNANFNDGIASKDGLAIEAGSISVVAVDDGIRGKDYVIVDGGTIAVDAGGDGIKSDNDEDADRGYVQLNGGVIEITAGDDGVQASTDTIVAGGQLTVDAGSASDSGRALQGDVMVLITDGEIDATATDDAIHSNNRVTIDGGVVTLAAGDDGVHGDLFVSIGGGELTITESFEGIESEVITIDAGVIDITSSDDGLNVASAAATTEEQGVPAEPGDVAPAPGEAPAAGGRPAPGGGGGGGRPAPGGGGGGGGGGVVEEVGDHYVYINGGTTVITITGELDEQGDGIDANGHIEMTGGLVVVSGPTDTRNSALDYSGGTFVMTGGTFIGTNVDGRNSEGIGSGSTQASLYATTGSALPATTIVHIEDADGESLVTFEPANAYNVVVFSSPDLAAGESYDVYFGGSVIGDSATSLYDASEYQAGDIAGTVTAT